MGTMGSSNKRKQNNRLSNRLMGVCFALLAASLMMAALIVNAQTDIAINSQKPDLDQEYREELDKWMLRAYEGDRDAQFKVGVLFTNSQFSKPDFEQAVYWYKQASRQGHVLAQYNLGHQYLTGVGVAQSEKTAMKWWLKAAQQDHALAQFNIGRAYYLGIGLDENHNQSRYWFQRAAQNQEPKSIEILQQLGWADGEQLITEANSKESLDRLVTQTPQAAPEPAETAGISSSANTENTTDESESQLQSKIIPAAIPVSTEPANQTSSNAEKAASVPIALYTDPAIRSVLITIIDKRSSLDVLNKGNQWYTVSRKDGFPVWVHGDFLKVTGATGTVTGSAVNARSVPIVTNGTVVGKLEKGEKVTILDDRNNWYRIISPARFTAWAKTEDFTRTATAPKTETPPAAPIVTEAVQNEMDVDEHNEWLFKQPGEDYTLQLASFDDPAKVDEFINNNKLIDNPELHRFSAKSKNIVWTYFLYGSYSSSEKAEAAKLKIKQQRAWVRNIKKLQQNRCVAWKTQLPTPPELNKYCTQ